MSDKSESLDDRLKKLEQLQRNTRIAIIIIVGYAIYDVISRDSGSDIIYAQKVKAKEFELVDGTGTVFGSWKLLDKEKREPGFVLESVEGQQARLSADKFSFLEGRPEAREKLVLDEDGVQLTPSSEQ